MVKVLKVTFSRSLRVIEMSVPRTGAGMGPTRIGFDNARVQCRLLW